MAHWTWALGPWRAGASAKPAYQSMGGPQIEIRAASSRSLKFKLTEPSTATISIDGLSQAGGILEELITDLWVYRDGEALFRGRYMPSTISGDEAGRQTYGVEFGDYRQVLERRIRWADRAWAAVEQSTIAWNLIEDMQGETGGNYGITKGAWPTTGVVRADFQVKAGDTVGGSLKTLAGLVNGFEYDIDVNLVATLYYPSRGKDLGDGAVLDYGGAIVKYDRRFDPATYSNAIRQSGADGTTASTTYRAPPGIETARQGRWEANYGDTALVSNDMVNQAAAEHYTRASLVEPSYSLVLGPGRWEGTSHVWLGDLVTVGIKHGSLFEVAQVVINEVSIDLDENDKETVTLVAGEAFVDQGTVLRSLARKVWQLSKH